MPRAGHVLARTVGNVRGPVRRFLTRTGPVVLSVKWIAGIQTLDCDRANAGIDLRGRADLVP